MIALAEGFALHRGWAPLVEVGPLVNGLAWRAEKIRMFGRLVAQPRLTCWMGSAAYTYSGVRHEPAPLPPVVEALRADLERVFGVSFNSVLANLYRDGADGVGWHADDERGMGDAPTIASLSFGATRIFLIRRNTEGRSTGVALHHGDLLVMSGASQRDYRHSIPKTARPIGPRVNLTFRRILAG